jgi:dTDP-4-dehydrorhamnose 3,5-epimerase
MPLFVQRHPKIITKNKEGRSNGWLVPIFNVHDGFIGEAQYPRQVYLTVIAPMEIKGPHLHLKRWGLFTCIRGNARIVVRTKRGYEDHLTGEDYEFASIQVPAGVPAALQNIGDKEAYLLNMPSPAWHIDDQDEHPVEFDKSAFIWEKEKK